MKDPAPVIDSTRYIKKKLCSRSSDVEHIGKKVLNELDEKLK
jgi:hypothetical protein